METSSHAAPSSSTAKRQTIICPIQGESTSRISCSTTVQNASGKWSMRTGFGIFYSQDAGNTRFDLSRNFGGRVTRVSDPSVPNLKVDNFIGSSGTTVVTLPLGGQVQAIKPNLPTTYTMQYLFNLQRQLSGNTVLEVGYDGNQSRHLGGLQNLNAPIPGTVGNPATP